MILFLGNDSINIFLSQFKHFLINIKAFFNHACLNTIIYSTNGNRCFLGTVLLYKECHMRLFDRSIVDYTETRPSPGAAAQQCRKGVQISHGELKGGL